MLHKTAVLSGAAGLLAAALGAPSLRVTVPLGITALGGALAYDVLMHPDPLSQYV